MKKTHQPARTLDLSAETIRYLTTGHLLEVVGGNKGKGITSSTCNKCADTIA